MSLEQEAKELIENIARIRTKNDVIVCLKTTWELDKKISSSDDISDLEKTLLLVLEQLPKIKTAVPEGFVIGAAIGAAGGYLATHSLFATACASVAGSAIGCFTMVAESFNRLGVDECKKQAALYSFNLLNLDLNTRIQLLQKQERISSGIQGEQRAPAVLRHRHSL